MVKLKLARKGVLRDEAAAGVELGTAKGRGFNRFDSNAVVTESIEYFLGLEQE